MFVKATRPFCSKTNLQKGHYKITLLRLRPIAQLLNSFRNCDMHHLQNSGKTQNLTEKGRTSPMAPELTISLVG